jgi:hypothetical protein
MYPVPAIDAALLIAIHPNAEVEFTSVPPVRHLPDSQPMPPPF